VIRIPISNRLLAKLYSTLEFVTSESIQMKKQVSVSLVLKIR